MHLLTYPHIKNIEATSWDLLLRKGLEEMVYIKFVRWFVFINQVAVLG